MWWMNDEKVYERKNQQLLQSVYRMNRTEWYGYSQSILTHQYDERITLFVFSHLAGSSWPHDICHRTYIWHLVFNMRKKNVHYHSQIGRQLSTLTNSHFTLNLHHVRDRDGMLLLCFCRFLFKRLITTATKWMPLMTDGKQDSNQQFWKEKQIIVTHMEMLPKMFDVFDSGLTSKS